MQVSQRDVNSNVGGNNKLSLKWGEKKTAVALTMFAKGATISSFETL